MKRPAYHAYTGPEGATDHAVATLLNRGMGAQAQQVLNRSSYRFRKMPGGAPVKGFPVTGLIAINGRLQTIHFHTRDRRGSTYAQDFLEAATGKRSSLGRRTGGSPLVIFLPDGQHSLDLGQHANITILPHPRASATYLSRLVVGSNNGRVGLGVNAQVHRRNQHGHLVLLGEHRTTSGQGLDLDIRGTGYMPYSTLRDVTTVSAADPALVAQLMGNFNRMALAAEQIASLTRPDLHAAPHAIRRAPVRRPAADPAPSGSVKPGDPEYAAHLRRTYLPAPMAA